MKRVPFQTPSHRQQSPPTPPPVLQPPAGGFDLVSPSVLLIIIILSAIFFVSGLFHLLVRLFLRPPNGRHPDEVESDVTALQGQLQQLFHLHDAGVDQSYIDILPVFLYKSVIGVKDPFDCAVCLCELEPEDKLRLLPNCSHAFHVDCIDMWLLSHSTCPLCRALLIPDSSSSCCAPVVCVLESGSDSSREMTLGGIVARESGEIGIPRKSCEVPVTESESVLNSGEKIVSLKLGKFMNVDGSGESSSNNVNSRRCFSMGSFAYVMDETTSLQVPIRTPAAKKQSSADKSGFAPLNPGHRSALSEYGSDSRREFDVRYEDRGGKGESFLISKICFRSGEIGKEKGCSKRSSSSSFRFPFRPGGVGGGASVDDMMKGGNWSENGGSEMGWNDDETQSFESHQAMASTTRRTLLWLMSRQQNNKISHVFRETNVVADFIAKKVHQVFLEDFRDCLEFIILICKDAID